MHDLDATTAPTRCPRCDSARVLPIAYGYPSLEMVEESAAGRVLLGGCLIFPDYLHWRCLDCGHAGQTGVA